MHGRRMPGEPGSGGERPGTLAPTVRSSGTLYVHPADPTPDSLVIPLGESYLYELKLANATKSRPQTAEYFFRNRVRQQAPLTDGVYKIHIPPMQQADRLEFFAGDVVRRLKIIPKARPSLLGATATVAYPPIWRAPTGRRPCAQASFPPRKAPR